MSRTPFHLAWFVSKGYGPKAWRLPWGGPNPASWVKPDLFVFLARELERAAFDYVMIEDSSNIPYTYRTRTRPICATRMIHQNSILPCSRRS